MNSKKSYAKRIIAMVLAVAMVASMSIISVFASSAVVDDTSAKTSRFAMLPLGATAATPNTITLVSATAKYSNQVAAGVVIESGKTEVPTGATVTVTAAAPAVGMKFDYWAVTGYDFGTLSNESPLSIEMPEVPNGITITAKYKADLDKVSLTNKILAANTLRDKYPVYNLEPNEVDAGVVYVKPAAKDALQASIETAASVRDNAATQDQLDNALSTLNAAMDSFEAAKKTGTKPAPAEGTVLTLTDATGVYGSNNMEITSGTTRIPTGASVTITANNALEGKVFDKWTVEGITLSAAELTVNPLNFTLPNAVIAGGVKITATYKDYTPSVQTTVVNLVDAAGTYGADNTVFNSGDEVPTGASVTITANNAPEGKVFDKWTVEGITLSAAELAVNPLTFTLPYAPNGITITATYKDAPTPATVDKTKLQAGITAAEAAASGVIVSDKTEAEVEKDVKFVTANVMNTFNTEITAAKAILNDSNASQADVDDGAAALKAATKAFTDAIKTGKKESAPDPDPDSVDKTELYKAFTAANAAKKDITVNDADKKYVTKGVKFVTTAVKDKLSAAMMDADKVSNNKNATQAEVDAAVKALNAAIAEFTKSIMVGEYVSSGGSSSGSSGGSSGGSSSTETTAPETTTDSDGNVDVKNPETTVENGKAEIAIPDINVEEGTEEKPVEIKINVPADSLVDMISESTEPTVEIKVELPKKLISDKAVIKDINMDKDIFKQARESGRTVEINIADEDGKLIAEWVFDGKKLENILDVNLSLEVKNSTAVPAIAKTFGSGAKAAVIRFNHSGVLPGEAIVRLNVSEDFAANDVLDLYYSNNGKLELVSKGITVDVNGIAAVNISHCSDYVLVKTGTAANGGTIVTNNPQTGDSNPLLPMMVLALAGALGLAGAAVVLKKKSN